MEYIRTTPHCGTSCWRLANGTVRHWHSGKKLKRRKSKCHCDACATPRRIERARLKVRLREESW